MANILVFNCVLPFPPYHSGNTVRVYHLSREIAKHHDCFLAAFADPDESYRELKATGLYKDILLLSDRAIAEPRKTRSLDLRTGYFAKAAPPEHLERTVGFLENFVHEHRIDLLITHTLGITKYAEPIHGVAHIVDLIDSHALAAERRYRQIKASLGWLQRFHALKSLYRRRQRERHVIRYFPCITTVSPIDKACFVSLNGMARSNVHVVPNGVAPRVLDHHFEGDEIVNAIVFFGTLDFPPNSTAVYYFYEMVFLPHLKDKGVTWYIVGRRPQDRMLQIAREHRDIVVTGEVRDMFGLISRIPIVINPMRIGGGLKNKVLEGMALQRLVISNQLGIEAIDAIRDVHYVHAETPEEFATEIVKYLGDSESRDRIGRAGRRLIVDNYTWSRVAGRYLELISRALTAHQARV